MTTTLSYELGTIIREIPGYDPYATAAAGEWFDQDAAQIGIEFIEECCTFSQGQGLDWRAGQPFILQPWEKAIVANLDGWKRADGTRRYREALVFVARKNGKSELGASLICKELFCSVLNDEPGAQLFSLAGKRDQTKYVFDPVTRMIANDSELRDRAQVYRYSVVAGDKSYRAICAEGRTAHGGSTQLAVIDELHAQRTRELYDVVKTSMGARLQPLLVSLTTSDYEREGSICNTVHDYASKVRDGIIEDSSFLPVIYEAEKDDDWTDPQVWPKANPNLGVTLSEEFLASECQRAQEEPEFENEFKRLHLDIRTEQAFRWMPMAHWDACDGPVDVESLKGKACWGGLDLASVQDMAALVLCFSIDGHYYLLPYYWCPADTAERRERRERQPYLTWSRQRLLELTPGNRTDYAFIRAKIKELGKLFKIQKIGFDPYNASMLVAQLADEDGFKMEEFRQGTLSMNEPMKSMMRLVLGRELHHGGHPILRWNANNTCARRDASDNLRPDKEKSFEKIDGLVAGIMSLGMAQADRPPVSYYETHEVR